MNSPVDLYDGHYDNVEADVYRAIRAETYGEDLGQTSWITANECREFCRWLELCSGQKMLEIACGSGGTARFIAKEFGVSVTGVDVNESAISAASAHASPGVEFHAADANQPLPFPDETFDALFCNDAFNHLHDRARALADCIRLLKPGGRYLYTDPTVVTGSLSNSELQVRSSIGFYLFTPPGTNEALINAAGFRLLLSADVTESVSTTARRWHDARAARSAALQNLEGDKAFSGLQRFLKMVYTLADERRLSRFAFVCEKPS